MNIKKAIELVKSNWDNLGECQSCGYHAGLYEYGPLEHAIEIDEDRKFIELWCMSGEEGHRGVMIYYGDSEDE